MQKFMDILEAKLMPIGIKLGNNRYLNPTTTVRITSRRS